MTLATILATFAAATVGGPSTQLEAPAAHAGSEGYEEPEPIREGAPTWLKWLGPALLLLAVLFWIYTARTVVKTGAQYRFPEVESVYKRSMFLANVLALVPGVVLGVLFGFALIVASFLFGPGILLPGAFLVALAIVLAAVLTSNWTALAGNAELQTAVRGALAPEIPMSTGHFVGVAPSKESSALDQLVDSHGDVGLLLRLDDHLVIEGMKARLKIPRTAITVLRRKLIWQFALLGARWLVIDYRISPTAADGDEIESLRLESRQGTTIRSVAESTNRLAHDLESWLR